MTTLTPAVNDNKVARSRAVYILAVACFPLLLSGLLTLIVFLTGAVKWDDGIGYKTDYAAFEFPIDGSKVTNQFVASGSIDRVPQGSVVYLVEQVDSRYWPKERLGDSTGTFSRKQFISDGAGYKYTIQLLALEPSAVARIEAWFETGRNTGKHPGLTDMNGAQVLAQVRVVR